MLHLMLSVIIYTKIVLDHQAIEWMCYFIFILNSGRNHAEEEIELLSDTTLPWSTTDYESLSSTTLISSDQDADLSPSLARREDNREQDIVVQDPQHDEDSQDDANDERVGREVGAFAVQSFIYYKCSASRKQCKQHHLYCACIFTVKSCDTT